MVAPARELDDSLRHVYSHRGAVGDEGRSWSSSQYSWKGRIVESLERPHQLLSSRPPDAPTRVIDLVCDRPAVLLPCVTPWALAEELFVGAGRHLRRRAFDVECRAAKLAPGAEL